MEQCFERPVSLYLSFLKRNLICIIRLNDCFEWVLKVPVFDVRGAQRVDANTVSCVSNMDSSKYHKCVLSPLDNLGSISTDCVASSNYCVVGGLQRGGLRRHTDRHTNQKLSVIFRIMQNITCIAYHNFPQHPDQW